MSYELPPIVKLAERLMGDIEIAVTRFPRRHRYSVGARLSEQIFEVAMCAHGAWRDREHQAKHLEQLAMAIDRLKLRMQLAQQVHAFASFAQFEALARTAADLGRQCGGWQKKRISKRQNALQPEPAAQRPQILSSHAASTEAIP
jgi:hypothetical protein